VPGTGAFRQDWKIMDETLYRLDGAVSKGLNWLARYRGLSAGLLVALCLALYLPGFASLPVTDRDEARFAPRPGVGL
jgi:hypothetical protein